MRHPNLPWTARLVPSQYREVIWGDALELAAAKRARLGRLASRLWMHAFLITAAVAAWRQKLFGAKQGSIPRIRRPDMFGSFASDFRYAMRSLARAPGFMSISVLTLALGIGGVTAMYSLVYASFIRPLAYDRADQLVVLNTIRGDADFPALSHPDLMDIRSGNQTLSDVATWRAWRVTFDPPDADPSRVWAASVDSRYLSMLGVVPAIGRQFTRGDDLPNHEPAIILSYALWQGAFGGDSAVIGQAIELDSESYTIVGVLPSGFVDPLAASFSLTNPPLWRVSPNNFTDNTNRSWRSFWGLARVAGGVSLEQVNADLRRIAASLEEDWPQTNTGVRYRADSLRDHLVGGNRATIVLLTVAVLLVLIVACANVANLLLTRGTNRTDEHAVRRALGAGRLRVVRPLIIEHAFIALFGMIAGLGTAWAITRLSSAWTRDLDALVSIRLDLPVLAGAAAMTLIVAMVFGLVPSLQAIGSESFVTRGHRTLGSPGARLRKGLVVVETAVAVALLLSSALLVKSFVALGRVDLGVDVTRTAVVTITPGTTRYPTPDALDQVIEGIITRVKAIPGVESAAIISDLPLAGIQNTGTLARLDRTYQPGEVPSAHYRTVTPDYFRTAGIGTALGRTFDDRDRSDGPPVIVLSEAAARELFPNEDPVGKGVRIMGFNRDVVGVVRDVRDQGPVAPMPNIAYVPYAQEVQEWALRTTTLVMAAREGAPADYFASVRDAIHSVDETIAINDMRTMEDVAASATRTERFRTSVMTVFAGVTLVLAMIGLAGVVAYQVANRRRELGLRMALGATGGRVISHVIRQGVRLCVAGAIGGMAVAAALGRWFNHLLFAVTPLDPVVFLSVPALFLVVAAGAALVPAVRAATVDPARSLRED